MSTGEHLKIGPKMRLLAWPALALVAILAFSGAVVRQKERARERSLFFLAANPEQGSLVFRAKGCIHCHSVNGDGGRIGPDLGRRNTAPPSLPKLITGMWNHAPRMWERMQKDGIDYPTLDYEEVAQVLAYIYMARHVDAPGDAVHGRVVFTSKGCAHCHSAATNVSVRVPDSGGTMGWSAALWNHAPAMLQAAERKHIAWPQFQTHELSDVYAFAGLPRASLPMGNPERGWRAFQQKSCSACHSIRSGYQLEGPNLGPEQQLPETFSDLSGVMLSHYPQMQKAMARQGMDSPALSAQEMTDIFAFLYSLRYVEPSGSPQVGASVFTWRGCSRCHGENAQGTARAPSLRGHTYNSITLGVVLWRHGQQMYAQTRKLGFGWPTLAEEDVGDLLAFLNLPADSR